MRIEISDDIGKALEVQAAARGLTLETWLKELVAEMPSATATPQEAAAGIVELQKFVKPDPEGWTVRDYIDHGRR